MTEREFPLQWPEGQPRTARPAASPYRRDMAAALRHLKKQLSRLGATDIVISSNIGGLTGSTGERDPGVAVYFNRRGRRHQMACDHWKFAKDNVNALGNALEHMRGMENSGCLALMERAFTAFTKLPPPDTPQKPEHDSPPINPWPDAKAMSREDVEAHFRKWSKIMHPDQGGTAENFAALVDWRDAALKQKAAP
ncbi:MAG: hypothetical protein NW215_10895 [Hyphomicrobiales bacterium]|nr:hypothetical protein [Hyphomicrobiales bacterium]